MAKLLLFAALAFACSALSAQQSEFVITSGAAHYTAHLNGIGQGQQGTGTVDDDPNGQSFPVTWTKINTNDIAIFVDGVWCIYLIDCPNGFSNGTAALNTPPAPSGGVWLQNY